MNYFREDITDTELLNFYRAYNNLKDKLNILDKVLEEYKSEVIDEKKPVNKRIFLKESMFKLAFKDVVEAHEELINVRTYDPDYVYKDTVDTYI